MDVRIEATAYTVPTDAPEADGTFAWASTTLVVVTAQLDGHTGLGWTYGPAATAAVIRELLVPALDGRHEPGPGAWGDLVADDPALEDVPAAWERMRAALRNAGRVGIGSLALSAVDCALWDLLARRRGLPLAAMLGAVRYAVPVYGSGGFTTYDEQQQHRQLAGWAKGEGIERVKIKIGQDGGRRAERDLARIAAARRTVGDGCALFVDANGGYSRKQAVRVAQAFADHDVTWFEEPVSSDDLAGLALVRDRVRADVTAGEYGFDLPYFARMVRVVDCLQIDVTRCGGITEFRRAAALAAAHGLEVSGHCAPHQHLAVAAATPNLRHLEWFHDHVRIEGLLFDGAAPAPGGQLPIERSTPGNGYTFRSADAERFRV
jgi:L-alanine-DL-glutamate epimerase-like enolase superfamily enzyme